MSKYRYREFDEGTWEVYDTATQKRTAYVGDEAFAQEITTALNSCAGSKRFCGQCEEVRAIVNRE